MQVHYDIDALPSFRNAVITIGTFDGVHKGHQQIISAMQEEARRINGETVLITFSPHPRKIIQPHTSLELINTLEEKVALLEAKGIDHLVVVRFTPDFARLTAAAYIERFLVQKFRPHTIIIGYDHHFGNNREGNFNLLEKNKISFGYKLIEIPKHVLNEISISSTKIRESIKGGEIEKANELLGYPFSFEGLVTHGDKIGRQIGYPTANLIYTDPDKIRLAEGVYAVEVEQGATVKGGMLSIGKRPTLGDTIERVEVNIFDFGEDIYGLSLRLRVKAFLRRQEKYGSLEDLTAQLKRDKEQAQAVLFPNRKSS